MVDSRKTDRSEYQRFYYEQHKDELSKRRKRKYREDTEYRMKVKEASKRYREEQKRNRKPKPKSEKKEREPRKPVVVKVGDTVAWGYTVSVLAKRIGRSINTVNKWISIGAIPKTPLWSKRGDRLYTDAMILIVKIAIQSRGIVGADPEVYNEIFQGWRDIGIKVKGSKKAPVNG